MTHVPFTHLHRFAGDPFILKIPVTGLAPENVQAATWRCAGVTKALGSGIAETGTTEAVIEVTIAKADTEAIGVGVHVWQAAAGPADPPVVAHGELRIDPRL